MKEPRGIHAAGGLTAISSEDTVYLVGDDGIRTITDPWFSYIHTVDILPDHHCLLVASSGLDCLFEFDTETLEKKYEWFAWENGFDIAHDPATGQEIVLTRSRSAAERMTQNGTAHLLVDNPRNEALPTAKRAAFINSVCYDAGRSTRFLGTYFHEGAVYAIDRMSGGATLVLDGLKNPHGGRNFRDGYMATSTGSGEVVIGSMNEQRRYDFSRISGKPDGLEDLEWLQNSIVFEDMIVTIDSNRTSFVIFNPDAGLCSVVPYDNNWAVQDLIVSELSCDQKRFIESVSDESVE
jgi:hypothetical protein